MATGEFAKLCKTTKATLFHYDQQDLLKPKYVSDNGYRHYGVEQFFDFDMITMLKETGSSLKEIKTYCHNTDGGDFLSLLEDKLLAVKKERKKLAQRERMIRDMTECTREALNFPYDTFMVQKHEEECLEACPTDSSSSESIEDFVARFVEYVNFYEAQDRFPRYPYGVILDRNGVLEGGYLERYFFGRATRATSPEQLHIKPAGMYAVFAHKGTEQTHLHAFGALLQQIKTEGLSIVGDVYVYDMMSYLLQDAKATYACKYCAQVG